MLFRNALRQPEARACSRFLLCCEERFADSFAVRKELPTWVVFFWNRQGFRAGACSMKRYSVPAVERRREQLHVRAKGTTDQSGRIELLIADLRICSRYFLAGRASLD